jgi:hypothetical protein
VRRCPRSAGVLAAIALAAAGISGGAASAATRPAPGTRAQWQADIAHVRKPGTGCYRASYPALRWQATQCVRARRIPQLPQPLPRRASHAGPAVVGADIDYSAQMPGLISQATGTFADVSPGITEQGKVNDVGSPVTNAFTLQLNSQFFAGSPACDGSAVPSTCHAWQQFLYVYAGCSGGASCIYMQYWLLNYDATCPAGWYTSAPDCYVNSEAVEVSTLTASQLGTVALSGSATSGGNDGVSLSVGSGQAKSVTGLDSVLDLAPHWNTTEWGVYGDGGGGEAVFGSGTTLQAQTALTATSASSPSCLAEGFTGETNNLTLTSTPALATQPAPTMASLQTDGTAGAASCAVISATNVVTVSGPGTQTTKKGTAVSLPMHATDSGPGQKLTYTATGLPAGLAINAATGLISGTPTTLESTTVKVTATDTTGASGSAGFGWIIYLNK